MFKNALKSITVYRAFAILFDLGIVHAVERAGFAILRYWNDSFGFEYGQRWALLNLVGSLGLCAYHLVWARMIGLCTPGETMAGFVLKKGHKAASNPFSRSPWLLFLNALLLLWHAAHGFGELLAGTVYVPQWSHIRVGGTLMLVLGELYATFKITTGHFRWSLVPVLLLGCEIVAALFGHVPFYSSQFRVIGFDGMALVVVLMTVVLHAPKTHTEAITNTKDGETLSRG